MKIDEIRNAKLRAEIRQLLADSVRSARTPAELEPVARDAALGTAQVQDGTGARILVRVTSFRRRLLDEDNLCEKFHTDLCRYAGLIPSDAPGTTKIEVSQEKVGSKEAERVRIEIVKP